MYGFVARGRSYDAQGGHENALSDFSKAIAMDDAAQAAQKSPNHSYASYWRGTALRAKGDVDGAIADFSKAVEQHPGAANMISMELVGFSNTTGTDT